MNGAEDGGSASVPQFPYPGIAGLVRDRLRAESPRSRASFGVALMSGLVHLIYTDPKVLLRVGLMEVGTDHSRLYGDRGPEIRVRWCWLRLFRWG